MVMLAYFVSMVLWVPSLMMRSRVWNLGYRFGEEREIGLPYPPSFGRGAIVMWKWVWGEPQASEELRNEMGMYGM